ENQLQVVRARLPDERIDRAPVEAPFGRLDQLPGNRCQHRVEVHLPQAGPMRSHVARTRGTRITELPTQHEEGSVVDDQLLRGTLALQMRDGGPTCQHHRQPGGAGNQPDGGHSLTCQVCAMLTEAPIYHKLIQLSPSICKPTAATAGTSSR